MEELKLLEILKRVKNILEYKSNLFIAKEYTRLEINNLKGLTQESCKNTMYHFYPDYCKYCSNINCQDNKNIDEE